VNIVVKGNPNFAASPTQNICPGDSVTLSATGGDTYLWSPATWLADPTLQRVTFVPQQSDTYAVHISENACHHDTTINVSVNVHPPPQITAVKSNDINCTNPVATLEARGGSTYSWSPAQQLSNASVANPIVSPDTTTSYTVTGKNEFGCMATASITVHVEKNGVPAFVVPSAFTPNNDGKNDCFGIQHWGNTAIQLFSIYNRWGKLIFRTTDPSKCWDGTWNGKPQDGGGYIYIIKASTLCGEVTRKGLLTLIR
jgi:gliding motility-associated-like protein